MSASSSPSATPTTTPKNKAKVLVQVYNFPPVPYVYSICPFGIKLESFLRINGIPHETIWTTNVSKLGTIPYCRFSSGSSDVDEEEEIPDSNLCLERLVADYDTGESTLNKKDRALTHTIIRMLEEHTTQIGFYFRYGIQENVQKFVDCLEIEDRFLSPTYAQAFVEALPAVIQDKAAKRGLTRHSDTTIWKFSHQDIQALEDMLDNNQYFLGGTIPTLVDCAVFGHLAQFLWIPIDFPQTTYLKEKCPNLVQFMERFREEVWPDWDELCRQKINQKYDTNNNHNSNDDINGGDTGMEENGAKEEKK